MKFAARVFAALLVCSSVAELHVSRPATQQSGPLPHSHVQEQDCTVIGWAELCKSQNLLTAGSCFQLQPGSVPRCQLQGPQQNAAATQLRSASDHVTTLRTSGELRITGHIQMTSLRFEAETLSLEDAEVDAWHEAPSDPREPIQFGGAFYARKGSFTLSRSNLTVRDTGAVNGGGFAVAGNLRVRQDSQIFIENVSAKKHAGGFLVEGNADIHENSLIFIHNARAGKSGGGFAIKKQLHMNDKSTISLHNVTAGQHGGGFRAAGRVVIAGHSTLRIANGRAQSGNGGGFHCEKTLIVSSSSTLVICNATAGRFGGGFTTEEVVIDGRSTVNITNSRAESENGGGVCTNDKLTVSGSSTLMISNGTAKELGGGFSTGGDVVIAGGSNVKITNSRADTGGGFYIEKLNVSSTSTVVICNTTAKQLGGGFSASEVVIDDGSTVNITNSRAESGAGGGFYSEKKLTVSSSSKLVICNATTGSTGGGFSAGEVGIAGSTLVICNATAGVIGGGFSAGDVVIAGRSTVNITNSRAGSGDGGGFYIEKKLTVSSNSTLVICNATAGGIGGGFSSGEVVIAGRSNVNISRSHAESGNGGGFFSEKKLTVSSSSTLVICNATAGKNGGGFGAGEVELTGRSTVNIARSHAESSGGGFYSNNKVTVSSSSTLVMWNATAGESGAGFLAMGKVAITGSSVRFQHARATEDAAGFLAVGDVVIAGKANVSVSNGRADKRCGGFYVEGRLHVNDSSTVSLENVTAGTLGGGFRAGEVVIAGRSNVNITNSRAESEDGGGFYIKKKLIVSSGSTLVIWNATAGTNGGGFSADEVVMAGRSSVNIANTRAKSGTGGGFYSETKLTVSGSSTLVICNATAGVIGGGFGAGEVVMTGRSTVNITNSRAESESGGGFSSTSNVTVSSKSTLVIWNATAGMPGGAFWARGDVVIAGKSNVNISNARANQQGGGFQVRGRLHINNQSTVSLENVTAGEHGGGFMASGEVAIADWSTLNITNSRAESGSGGGFYGNNKVTVSFGSTLVIWNAKAGMSGGGFLARGKVVINSSAVRVQHAMAMQQGGGFASEDRVELVHGSRALVFNSSSGADGGACIVEKDLFLNGSELFINKSTALRSGAGGRVDGQVLLASESKLVVHGAEGPQDSSVLAASCLHLHEQSNILLEGVVGGYGMDLQNADCKKNGGRYHSTFEVSPDATINASGRLASGLLSVAGCPSEKIHLTGIYLQAWSSPLLSTLGKPGHVVVDQVRIDYEAPVNNLPVLAVEDGHSIDSLMASCGDCAHGLTFNATTDGKHVALSVDNLRCPKTVAVSKGSTTRCECGDYQITHPDFRDKKLVRLERIFETCMFCEAHTYFENGACQKCGLFSAWSDGGEDVCHTWPLEQTQCMLLFLGTASVVLTIFIAWEIIKAPLIIVEAKSTTANNAKGERTFTFSVQGPVVALPKKLSSLIHRRISYCVQGTDLFWLDYAQNSKKVVKVSATARRKLVLENLAVPFDCGACKGAMQATDFSFPFIVLTALITLAVMLPIVINIAVISGNELEHIVATSMLAILPMAVVAALFHVPVAWFLRRWYSRTPFREALGHYEKQIHCTPYTGPDANHPYNQGLQAATLRGLWQHFEGFILAYNMHFVVSNFVRPLTKCKQVSFVTLWGGRRVDYFVSHSWGTGFHHFVDSIHCHALSKEGPAWTDAAYWICSFANNQWNIAAELGTDPMSSAFARVLTAGPKEVAMVLDKEVQPLTRVWCLFEFLLANRHQVDLVFVTADGVVGTEGCSSFDIALEMGNKIESLQVATCQASSEKDKKDIFAYIVSELGSLECMDEQIRSLMGDMLVNNLTNVGRATENLLKRLGQKKRLSS